MSEKTQIIAISTHCKFQELFKIYAFDKKIMFFLLKLFFSCKNTLFKIRISLGKTLLWLSRNIYSINYTKKVYLYRLK